MEQKKKIRKIKKFRKITTVVDDLIIEKARKEAVKILLLASYDDLIEFYDKYDEEVNGNICCMILDSIKMKLVKEDKMKQNDNDCFGDDELLKN